MLTSFSSSSAPDAKYSHGYGVCSGPTCTFYSPHAGVKPVQYNNCPPGTRSPYYNKCYPNV